MNDSKKILIAGGTGFIGNYISQYLSYKGHAISLLSRKKSTPSNYTYYDWNPMQGEIDDQALRTADIIINISGAGIADKLWTRRRKEIIYHSRIDSTALLVEKIIKNNYSPSLFINASAIGYYGNRPDELLSESSKPGTGFVAKICQDWEMETNQLNKTDIPTAILRIGIVLGKEGGSLSKLILPLRYGVNILFDRGQHTISWIHIHDLAFIIEQLISRKLQPGIYNAVSPNAISQKAFNAEVLKALRIRNIKLSIPSKVLRLLVGGIASVITADQNVKPTNLIRQNFLFSYPDIQDALTELVLK
jgi:uncharacterized protein (TIGR01777 family)